MRQKKLKHVNHDMLKARGVLTDIKKITIDHPPVYLEIGSGKGQFIAALATDHPSHHYIGLEVNINICYRILEKKESQKLSNLSIILGDANHLLDYFSDHEIDGIYLNFSDPWPKLKHHKRRLTSPKFLRMYQTILKPDGFLQVRTDHTQFFEESVIDLDHYFQTIKIDHDLEVSQYMTEYEEKKRPVGPIYQWIGKVKPHAE